MKDGEAPGADKTGLFARIEAASAEMRAAAADMRLSARISALPEDRLCPIYFNDRIYRVAMTLVEFDPLQQQLLRLRQPIDPLLLTQLFDLVPNIGDKVVVDVGGYCGLMTSILANEITTGKVHVFEPQAVALPGLTATIEANDLTARVTIKTDIIGEADAEMEIADARPDRLSNTRFIQKAGGTRTSRSIDSLRLKNVGLLHMDFAGSKIPALRGAAKLIEKEKPVIVLDLLGRDVDEIKAILDEHGYLMQRAGRHSAIFLPE